MLCSQIFTTVQLLQVIRKIQSCSNEKGKMLFTCLMVNVLTIQKMGDYLRRKLKYYTLCILKYFHFTSYMFIVATRTFLWDTCIQQMNELLPV